ncbi:MAG: peptide/nickel transport system permease protein [Myxococcota bacterium]|jgi:peptide/nickel transport system permease protein
MAKTGKKAKVAENSSLMAIMLGNKKALVGVVIVGFFILLALLGPLFVGDPTAFIGIPLSPPSGEHLFGLTGQGQDVLAQTVVGARTTLLVALTVGVSTVGLGAFIGVAAGFYGGKVDGGLSLFINIFLVIPGLPLAIVLAAYLPSGPVTIALVLILTGWAWNARVVRAQTLSLRGKEFVAAAIVGGEKTSWILVRELLPNMFSLLASQFIGATIYAIGAQVGLEFLGLGDVSEVTWGTNLYWASNDQALLTGSWWTFVPTGLCVAMVGFGLAMINFAVDEFTNRRLSAERSWRRYLRGFGDKSLGSGFATPVVRAKAATLDAPGGDP